MKRPVIKIELVSKKGNLGCHRGHKIGDFFDFDKYRGEICPMAMHVLFSYIDILRYGGDIPVSRETKDIRVSCPDTDVINIF